MSDEWKEQDSTINRGFYRYELRGERPDTCIIIDNCVEPRGGWTGRKWEWWTMDRGWNSFPRNVRTLEQRKAYVVAVARLS